MESSEAAKVRRLITSGAARAIRIAAGASLAAVARDVGVHRATVLRWERGERQPGRAATARYLEVLAAMRDAS